jgi:hypothetical protein
MTIFTRPRWCIEPLRPHARPATRPIGPPKTVLPSPLTFIGRRKQGSGEAVQDERFAYADAVPPLRRRGFDGRLGGRISGHWTVADVELMRARDEQSGVAERRWLGSAAVGAHAETGSRRCRARLPWIVRSARPCKRSRTRATSLIIERLEDEVVLPHTGDLQISERDPEWQKPVPKEDALRRDVVQQRRCLNPMQAEFAEREGSNLTYGCGGKASTAIGRRNLIAEVARLEGSSHDVTQSHAPNDALSIENDVRRNDAILVAPNRRRNAVALSADCEVRVIPHRLPRGKELAISRQQLGEHSGIFILDQSNAPQYADLRIERRSRARQIARRRRVVRPAAAPSRVSRSTAGGTAFRAPLLAAARRQPRRQRGRELRSSENTNAIIAAPPPATAAPPARDGYPIAWKAAARSSPRSVAPVVRLGKRSSPGSTPTSWLFWHRTGYACGSLLHIPLPL